MKENFFEYFKICLLEDKLPHAFLIETENLEETFLKVIKLLNENNLINTLDYINNINLIVIEPDGKEIKSESIANLQKRFSLKPLNDNYNIYIIKEANKMNISSANKLLKFLEEPNSTTIGILLATNSQVLPTIKSRCQIFKILDDKNYTELEKEATILIDFLNNMNNQNEIECKKRYTKYERTDLINLFELVINSYNNVLKECSLQELKLIANIILVLENVLRMLKSNVNIELLLDKLCIEVKNS
ncbi:MAG: hypothetical protein GX265_04940 [Mollicutes bacterium]|nr:hypothetical protein [Mollicutes bacterium]